MRSRGSARGRYTCLYVKFLISPTGQTPFKIDISRTEKLPAKGGMTMRTLLCFLLFTLELAGSSCQDAQSERGLEAANPRNPGLESGASREQGESLATRPRPELPIKLQEPSKELRVHLVQGSGRSSYTFVRAKF